MPAFTNMEILIVEDDADFRENCIGWFNKRGHQATGASNGQDALHLLERRDFDVAVIDMRMPGLSGLEVLQRMRERDFETEAVILTGEGTIESAVEAMKIGAADYLTKPAPLSELEHRCRLACERRRIRKENRQWKAVIQRSRPTTHIIGTSAVMQEVFRMIERAGPSDKPVLIQGESGTGKELVAQALQQAGPRAEKPFVTVNCGALPEQLVESEFFGHEQGAFTGATDAKPGLFEVADGGTLFIDEIGELQPSLQPKLLRVLEGGWLRRVGSHKERRVDVRLLAATNRDLQADVRAGRFREDLFYRIHVVTIDLPPLRERQSDIGPLIDHFLTPNWRISDAARRILEGHDWPGNVRQLKNSLERAQVLCEGRTITPDDLPRDITAAAPDHPEQPTAPLPPHSLEAIEREHIMRVLQQEKGNKARAARALGIHRRKLYRLLERFGIELTDDR